MRNLEDTTLTASQAAKLLNIHINTLRRWTNKDVVDTHGRSPWNFTGQASLDLNPGPPVISHTQ